MSGKLAFGLIEAGRIGRFRAETLARRLPGARLVAVADSDIEAARTLDDADRAITAAEQSGAQAALIHPQHADAVYLDTSVVHLAFDNGAFDTAEASFQAIYGYDVRSEVFGSAGVLLAGPAPEQAGRLNIELFADAYVQQFAHFVDRVGSGASPSVTGNDARVALEIALAAAQSVRTGAPVALAGTVRS